LGENLPEEKHIKNPNFQPPDSEYSWPTNDEDENHILFGAAFIDFWQSGFIFKYINLRRRENDT
jgi:hypothetical protein